MELEDSRSALGQLNDPNIKLIPGKLFRSCVDELGLTLDWKVKSSLTLEDIQEFRKVIKKKQDSLKSEGKVFKRFYINEIFKDSEVLIPTLEIPERNPELEKRLNALKRKLEEKEYQRMTRNVNTCSNQFQQLPEDSISHQMKQMNSAIIAVIQFVISLAAAFLFGFIGIEIFTGPLDLAVRLLLGIGAAVIVGVAELYILVVHLDARETQEKKIQ